MSWSNLARFCSALFFTFHAFAILTWNASVASNRGASEIPKLHYYLSITGTVQRWRTFITVPTEHSLAVEVGVETSNGNFKRGPLLPGMREYDEKLRTDLFFNNIQDERREDRIKRYVNHFCRQLLEKESVIAERITLLFYRGQIRSLPQIRTDGEISRLETLEKGPYTCPGTDESAR